MNSAVPEANAFMERLRSRFFEERERFFSGSCGVRGPGSGDLATSGDLALSGDCSQQQIFDSGGLGGLRSRQILTSRKGGLSTWPVLTRHTLTLSKRARPVADF